MAEHQVLMFQTRGNAVANETLPNPRQALTAPATTPAAEVVALAPHRAPQLEQERQQALQLWNSLYRLPALIHVMRDSEPGKIALAIALPDDPGPLLMVHVHGLQLSLQFTTERTDALAARAITAATTYLHNFLNSYLPWTSTQPLRSMLLGGSALAELRQREERTAASETHIPDLAINQLQVGPGGLDLSVAFAPSPGHEPAPEPADDPWLTEVLPGLLTVTIPPPRRGRAKINRNTGKIRHRHLQVAGADLEPAMSLEAVAQALYRDGDTPRVLSRERIRQIEATALAKLRVELEALGLDSLETVLERWPELAE
ncbi:hypothetical protein [Parahaliea mediterranea]|uniref:hypothetical protein n=1 Tax=Parahaliea mediterranea TaxID=651086 RepID=UPI000E2EE7CD|nr:hypothetical protein [Parahaliea mediterranea]